MPKAYSGCLRERVVARVEGVASRRVAAEHYDISASTAVIWIKSFHETDRRAAKLRRENTCSLDEHTDCLQGLVDEQPDLTLDEVVHAMHK